MFKFDGDEAIERKFELNVAFSACSFWARSVGIFRESVTDGCGAERSGSFILATSR